MLTINNVLCSNDLEYIEEYIRPGRKILVEKHQFCIKEVGLYGITISNSRSSAFVPWNTCADWKLVEEK